jgi:nicotinate-nucleotide adenylyltransferase
MTKQIGLYGGSFDPVHNGHLQVAANVMDVLDLDRFFFIPASFAPHKQDVKQADIHQRLDMLQCAVKEMDKVEISMCEIERGGVSYTVETIRYFRTKFPKAKLYFLIGSDSLHHFDSWFQVDELMRLCCVTIFSRKGYNSIRSLVDQMNFDVSMKEQLLQQHLNISIDEVSSTRIRDAIRSNLPIHNMVHPCVNKYIVDNSVYDR